MGGGAMATFLSRLVLQAIIVLILVSLITMWLIRLVPGGPVVALVGLRATPAQISYYSRLYGFDQPVWVQYWKWVSQFAQGNFGYSVKNNLSVASEIAQYLPKTLVLVGLGLVVSLIFGIPLGIYQAVKRYTVGDYVLTWVSFLGYATPKVFVGLILSDWFYLMIRCIDF